VDIVETKIRSVSPKIYGPAVTHVRERYAMIYDQERQDTRKALVSEERLTRLEANRILLKDLMDKRLAQDKEFLAELKRIKKMVATVEK
jgi:hypothetical protein